MISWVPFNQNDKETWPPYSENVFVIYKKKGQAHFYNEAFLCINGKWYLQLRNKSGRKDGVVELGEFDENSLAWTTVNFPNWWKMKEKK